MNAHEIEQHWTKIATEQLVGRTIVAVRYMTLDEQKDLGWYSRPVVLQLSDGNLIYPSKDDEGNDAGALFTANASNSVLPVI